MSASRADYVNRVIDLYIGAPDPGKVEQVGKSKSLSITQI